MNIFVGNLAFSTTDQDLRQLFEPFGVVDEIRVIMDRDTGRSKGFGFVEMPDGTAARTAMAKLQGQEMEGRTLTVNEAKRFCRKVRFLGKIQKSGVKNSMTYRLPNSRKSNFATEPLL